MSWRPDASPVRLVAGYGSRGVEQPVLVAVFGALPDARAELVERVEALIQSTCSLRVWLNFSTQPLVTGS